MHAQGRTLFVLGRYEEAEACFKRRIIHLPATDVSRAYLASLYGRTGRHDAARRVWDELMARHPGYTIGRTLRVLPYRDSAPLEHFVGGTAQGGVDGLKTRAPNGDAISRCRFVSMAAKSN